MRHGLWLRDALEPLPVENCFRSASTHLNTTTDTGNGEDLREHIWVVQASVLEAADDVLRKFAGNFEEIMGTLEVSL